MSNARARKIIHNQDFPCRLSFNNRHQHPQPEVAFVRITFVREELICARYGLGKPKGLISKHEVRHFIQHLRIRRIDGAPVLDLAKLIVASLRAESAGPNLVQDQALPHRESANPVKSALTPLPRLAKSRLRRHPYPGSLRVRPVVQRHRLENARYHTSPATDTSVANTCQQANPQSKQTQLPIPASVVAVSGCVSAAVMMHQPPAQLWKLPLPWL